MDNTIHLNTNSREQSQSSARNDGLRFSPQEVKDAWERHKQWQEEKRLSPDNSPEKKNTFKTIILGAGATAAFWIKGARKEEIDPEMSIIIGGEQPWFRERGQDIIPQPNHMIIPGESTIDDKWTDAKKFSEAVKEVFVNSDIPKRNERVQKVERISESLWYKITLHNSDTPIYAKSILDAMGAGKDSQHFKIEEILAKNDDEALSGTATLSGGRRSP